MSTADGLEPQTPLLNIKVVLDAARSTFSSNSVSGWLPIAINREANLEQAFAFIEEGYDYFEKCSTLGHFGPDDVKRFNVDILRSVHPDFVFGSKTRANRCTLQINQVAQSLKYKAWQFT
jgi:hypothetical protein